MSGIPLAIVFTAVFLAYITQDISAWWFLTTVPFISVR